MTTRPNQLTGAALNGTVPGMVDSVQASWRGMLSWCRRLIGRACRGVTRVASG